MSAKIIVTEYDPFWEQEFKKLKEKFIETLGKYLITVEHVGSTSVQGMSAKPILDIILVIKQKDFEIVKQLLGELQYSHNGDQGILGREVFKLHKDNISERFQHHLYVSDQNGQELKRMLIFRNYLRSDPKARETLSAVKMQAVELYPSDINKYMDHKGVLVTEILSKALIEIDELPSINVNKCITCQSTAIEKNFKINYLGNGYKEEIYNIICMDCKHQWIEKIQ
jgi:GrpB-like predicted nucleotidyltransferase (UPF0157 family)